MQDLSIVEKLQRGGGEGEGKRGHYTGGVGAREERGGGEGEKEDEKGKTTAKGEKYREKRGKEKAEDNNNYIASGDHFQVS